MQNLVPNLYYVYALFLFAGGVMGFVSAKSVPSLIGSSVFAAVSIAAALMAKNNPRLGLTIGLVNAIAVAGFFVYRYATAVTPKPFPAFPAIGLSVIILILSIVALIGLNKEPGA